MTAFIAILAVWLWAGAAMAAPAPVILVLGDSLSAAYGLPQSQGWVALLQARLREQGYPHTVVNASISGETSAGGLARLPRLLRRHRPQLLLLQLGANDGLRGLPLPQLRKNLERMLRLGTDSGARVLLFEMRLPLNYGAYGEAFGQLYPELARRPGVTAVPFFLGPIVLDPAQFQDDGLHPNAGAQQRLLEAVWPTLAAMLHPEGGRRRTSLSSLPARPS